MSNVRQRTPTMVSAPVRFGLVFVQPTSSGQRASGLSAMEIQRPSSSSASARAARPPAASEPIEVIRTRSRPERAARSTGAGFARVGRQEEIARRRHRRFLSCLGPKTKHNAGMASALTASPRSGNVDMIGQRPLLSSGFGAAALPNHSVELTNCSKLQFAAHLER